MTIEIDSHALMAVFLPQADENLLAMEQAVLELERETDPTGPLDELFRHAHTLKSDAAAVGFNELGSAAHQFEDQLEGLKERRIDLDQELISGLLEIVDGLREQLDRSKSGDAGLSQKLHRALTGLGKRLGSQVDLPRGDPGADPQSATVDAGSDSARTSRPHTLRVEIAKLDQLTSLTGELAIARGRFSQLLSQPKVSSAVLTEEFHRSEQLYGALHELAISLRMVPIGPVFAQYGRLVRDLAVSMGKKVRLEVEGGEVEIDNSILQLLADPLTHLIRNALDHGIEGPAERLQQGKPTEGVVRLIARQLANRVVIQVHDDGRGIDPENVLRRARELGRIGDHEQPTPLQLQALVLEAGFSTTDVLLLL